MALDMFRVAPHHFAEGRNRLVGPTQQPVHLAQRDQVPNRIDRAQFHRLVDALQGNLRMAAFVHDHRRRGNEKGIARRRGDRFVGAGNGFVEFPCRQVVHRAQRKRAGIGRIALDRFIETLPGPLRSLLSLGIGIAGIVLDMKIAVRQQVPGRAEFGIALQRLVAKPDDFGMVLALIVIEQVACPAQVFPGPEIGGAFGPQACLLAG